MRFGANQQMNGSLRPVVPEDYYAIVFKDGLGRSFSVDYITEYAVHCYPDTKGCNLREQGRQVNPFFKRPPDGRPRHRAQEKAAESHIGIANSPEAALNYIDKV